jgi:hypothetical protein
LEKLPRWFRRKDVTLRETLIHLALQTKQMWENIDEFEEILLKTLVPLKVDFNNFKLLIRSLNKNVEMELPKPTKIVTFCTRSM